MRILVVTQHFWPTLGGAEVILRRLAAEWARTRHQVTVLTQRWDHNTPELEECDGFQVLRMPVRRTRFIGTLHYIASLRKLVKTNASHFDVVYVSMLKHAAYACMTIPELKMPIVLRAEGAGPTGDAVWQDKAFFGSTIRRACQRASAIVAPSQEIVEELTQRGYDRTRLHYIPNGVSIPAKPWMQSQTSLYRSKLKLPDRRTIVYTGRLHADKGLADLLEAAKGIPDTTVLLIGDGPERSSLENKANELGISARVVFAGRVDDVEAWLRASDVFVLPSYQEGLSVSLLEALASGMPCAASDIPANKSLGVDEDIAFFSPRQPNSLCEAITQLMSVERRDSLSHQRAVVSSAFNLASMASAHVNLFRDIVSGTDENAS